MYDVEIVMPVYNEAACINEVLDDWIRELDLFGISYRLLVLNDGSRDNTAEVLARYDNNPKVKVINKQNSGHGPTILQGYHIAAQAASWVFQVDSDNEIKAEHFKTLWAKRENWDAIIGIRDGRQQPLPRKIISFFSRLVVRIFYGRGIMDVNCPFRLMRAEVLKQILPHIPENTFAPNVAISGFLALMKAKVLNIAVPHANRQTGEVSIKRWKLLKAAIKSFVQVIQLRFQHS
jgi:glycosyltransferase involved in cell wall biosynthesis